MQSLTICLLSNLVLLRRYLVTCWPEDIMYGVCIYPFCMFLKTDEKHFLKFLVPLTVFLQCLSTVCSLLLLEIVLFMHTYFFSALELSASRDFRICNICWLSFFIFLVVLQYFLHEVVYWSSRIISEIFPFNISCLQFFFLRLRKEAYVKYYICICIPWEYVFFFTHVDMHLIW